MCCRYAAVLLLLLGWIFAPIYLRIGIYTTPEYLERRFGRICRHYLSFITVIMYVLTKISASLFAGALILQGALGWNLYFSAGAIIVLCAVYTVTGGLKAVMYTDFIQCGVFLIGGTVVSISALSMVGGVSGLRAQLAAQGKEDFFHMMDSKDYPWTGMFFG